MNASLNKLRHRQAAFSLIEAIMAMAVGMMALSSAFLLDSYQLRMVKSTRESGAASLSLEERVEQLRIATWRQITDPEYLSKTYFATVPRSVSPLDDFSEWVKVEAWPDPDVCQPLIVEKRQGSAAKSLAAGAGISSQRLAKIDVRITWRSNGGRTRVRELTTIISNGGISRMNLPAMGNAAGVPPAESSSPADSVAEPSPSDSNSDPIVNPTPDSPLPVESPLTTKKNNGRGNVNGKPGKA